MHNLWTVTWFEFTRTLKKKSFWLSLLAFPALFAAIAAVMYFSAVSSERAAEEQAKEEVSLAVLDHSGLLNPQLLAQAKVSAVAGAEEGIAQVKSGQTDAFFIYPADPSQEAVRIYAQDDGLFGNAKYESMASSLMQASLSDKVSPQIATLIQHGVTTHMTTFTDGQQRAGFERVVAPAAFLVLFYAVMVLLSNRMLSSTIEEKENRVIEMILTTVEANTLILGKILALILIGIVQVVAIVVPILIIVLSFGNQLNIPNFDLSTLTITTQQAIVGSLTFIFSFLLMTGSLVAIGAAVPTAKEANNFFSIVILAMLIPLYALAVIISSPEQLLVQVMTYFPLTSPVTLFLRNAADNILWWEAAISIVILATSALLSMAIAARTFGYGTLEYNRTLSWKEIIGRKA